MLLQHFSYAETVYRRSALTKQKISSHKLILKEISSKFSEGNRALRKNGGSLPKIACEKANDLFKFLRVKGIKKFNIPTKKSKMTGYIIYSSGTTLYDRRSRDTVRLY